MAEEWFTEEQVQQVAKDIYEFNADNVEAATDMVVQRWGEVSQDVQQRWLDRARAQLAAVVPLDLSRPLRLRDGTPVTGARLSDDGLCIIADVAAWGSSASWPRSGAVDDDPSDQNALVYADEVAGEQGIEP